MNWNKQHNKNKQEQKQQKNKTNYPFKQHNSKKTPELKENSFFSLIESKTSNRTKTKTLIKNKKYQNKANIETERLKHTPWKQKQEQQKKKTNCQKSKQLGFKKGDVRKVCFKQTSKH